HDAIAPSVDGAADELLVHSVPVDVGGVDEVDAALEGAVHPGDHGVRARLPVDRRAEPDPRHLEPAEAAPQHGARPRARLQFLIHARVKRAYPSRSPGILANPARSRTAASRRRSRRWLELAAYSSYADSVIF